MDEKKKPAQVKPEKKLSRTTLTFYIVGLFSVAIALILISYVAQARADRQLDTLTNQLNEQQTVAQGATQKMEDLQAQYDAQSAALDKVREVLDTELAKTDVVSATIIAARSMDCDGWSTTAFMLGTERAIDTIEQLEGIEAVLIDERDEVWWTSGIEDALSLIPTLPQLV